MYIELIKFFSIICKTVKQSKCFWKIITNFLVRQKLLEYVYWSFHIKRNIICSNKKFASNSHKGQTFYRATVTGKVCPKPSFVTQVQLEFLGYTKYIPLFGQLFATCLKRIYKFSLLGSLFQGRFVLSNYKKNILTV